MHLKFYFEACFKILTMFSYCSYFENVVDYEELENSIIMQVMETNEHCSAIDANKLIDYIYEKCGTDTEHNPIFGNSQWPSSSQNLLPTSQGNPWESYKMQLYSRTGYHLAVYPDGKVNGTLDDNDLHTFLELSSAGGPGLVKIKGLLANSYIGMNRRGRLYGEPDPNSDSVVFIERFNGSYTTYMSKLYEDRHWYIGIKRSGQIKGGRRTGPRQRAIKFLPRRKRFE